MPEEKKDDKGPEPQVNVEALRGMIEQEMGRMAAEGRFNEPTRSEPAPREPVMDNRHPLTDIVQPIVEPQLRQVATMASAAQDAAIFYSSHPEAIKYRAEIERDWQAMAKNGVYLTREAVFNHFKGQNFDKFSEDKKKADEAAAAAAAAANGVGIGAQGLQGGGAVPAGDPVTWTDEQLDNFLKKGTGNVLSF